MKCPVCKDVTLLMSEKNGVEIDYCPECRGIWLDRGELDKILERARVAERGYERQTVAPAADDPVVARRHDDDDDDDRDDRRHASSRRYDDDDDYRSRGSYDKKYAKRKKSPFSELFEMFGGEDD